MTGNLLAKTRAAAVRCLAVVAVVGTCAAGSIGTQVATAIGVSTLALTTTATPAGAWWRRGWGWRGGWGRHWGWHRPIFWRRPVVWGGWGWRRGWGWRGGWGRGWRRW
jgi:hypothetical protein